MGSSRSTLIGNKLYKADFSPIGSDPCYLFIMGPTSPDGTDECSHPTHVAGENLPIVEYRAALHD